MPLMSPAGTTASIFNEIENLTISGGTFTFTHSPVNNHTGQSTSPNHGPVLNNDHLLAPIQNHDYRQHATGQESASNDNVSPRSATIRNEYAASYERDAQPECQEHTNYQSQSPPSDGPCYVDQSNRYPSRSQESQGTGRQNELVRKGRTLAPEVESEKEENRRGPAKVRASTERHGIEMGRNKRSQTIPVGKPRKVEFEDASEGEEESSRELANERGKQVTTMERRSTESKRSQMVPTVKPRKAKFENISEEEEEGSLRKPVKERRKQASTAERGSLTDKRNQAMPTSTKEVRHTGKNRRSQTVPVGKPRKAESESESEDSEEGDPEDSGEEDTAEQTQRATVKKGKKKAKNPTVDFLPPQPGYMGSPNSPWLYPGSGFPPAPWQGSPYHYGPNPIMPSAGQWNLGHSTVTFSNNGNDYSTNIHSGNSSYSSQSNVGNDHSQNITKIKKRRH